MIYSKGRRKGVWLEMQREAGATYPWALLKFGFYPESNGKPSKELQACKLLN